MKWNILVASLVLGLGLCSQSFGFELLDRMLGVNHGCGCDTGCAPSCGAPSGCGAASSCCDSGCGQRHHRPLFGHRKACGCDVAPSCGCDVAPKCGCNAAPSCGCESACGNRCCGLGLLDRIFSCHRRSCCDSGCGAVADSGCGCGGGHISAPGGMQDSGDMAPMPPAPVVDPSAFLPSQRRVVHASTNMLR